MTLAPAFAEFLARARSDLRIGLPVLLSQDQSFALVVSAETLSNERLNAMRALGEVELAITAWRAQTLKARVYDDDLARLPVPGDVNVNWVQSVADPVLDLATPLKGPFVSNREGSAALHRLGVRLVKAAHLLPAVVVVPLEAENIAAFTDLTRLDFDEAMTAIDAPAALQALVSGRIPLSPETQGRVHVFRPSDGGEEHYAVEVGQPDRAGPVLVRLHSACFTGDVLGSLKCDCGPQLTSALGQMKETGAGILLYLNQEGRGIGLANKMRAYSLQDQGFDTVEANHRLGFEDDERDFRLGAEILGKLGVGRVRLLTNNPAKVEMMTQSGIEVAERVPLKAGRNHLNEGYLDTKAEKSGHLL